MMSLAIHWCCARLEIPQASLDIFRQSLHHPIWVLHLSQGDKHGINRFVLWRTALQAEVLWCVIYPRALPSVTQGSALQAPERLRFLFLPRIVRIARCYHLIIPRQPKEVYILTNNRQWLSIAWKLKLQDIRLQRIDKAFCWQPLIVFFLKNN